MNTKHKLSLELLIASVLIVSSTIANATTLVFDATYQTKQNLVGADTNTDTNFSPVNFQFAVSFDPQVKLLNGPVYNSGSYSDYDGATNYWDFAFANTFFGLPTFSPSPFTSQISNGLINNPASWNGSQSSQNQSFSVDSRYGSSGYSGVTFMSYFQVEPNLGSNKDYAVHAFEVYFALPSAPKSLSEVGLSQPNDFLNYLIYARDNKVIWSADEFGQHYSTESYDSRVGEAYAGNATLISIDGVKAPSAVPLPAALPLMLSGLGILGFASRRKTINS